MSESQPTDNNLIERLYQVGNRLNDWEARFLSDLNWRVLMCDQTLTHAMREKAEQILRESEKGND